MRNPFRRRMSAESARRRITAVLLTFDEILATPIFSNVSPPAAPSAGRSPSPKSAPLVEREVEQIKQLLKDARKCRAQCSTLARDWTARAEEAVKVSRPELAAEAHLRAATADEEAESWLLAEHELEQLLSYAHDSLKHLRHPPQEMRAGHA